MNQFTLGYSMAYGCLRSYAMQNVLIYGNGFKGMVINTIVGDLLLGSNYNKKSFDFYVTEPVSWNELNNVTVSFIDKNKPDTIERLINTALFISDRLNKGDCKKLDNKHVIIIDNYKNLIEAYDRKLVDLVLEFIMKFGPEFGIYTIICSSIFDENNTYLVKKSTLRVFYCGHRGLDTQAISSVLFKNGLRHIYVTSSEFPHVIEKLSLTTIDMATMTKIAGGCKESHEFDKLDLFLRTIHTGEDELISTFMDMAKTVQKTEIEGIVNSLKAMPNPIIDLELQGNELIPVSELISNDFARELWEN